MTRQATLAEAKRLLREQVAKSPDAGVRAINELVELSDDHPAVLKIAALLSRPQNADRLLNSTVSPAAPRPSLGADR